VIKPLFGLTPAVLVGTFVYGRTIFLNAPLWYRKEPVTVVELLPLTVDPTIKFALPIPLSVVSSVLSGKFKVAHCPLL